MTQDSTVRITLTAHSMLGEWVWHLEIAEAGSGPATIHRLAGGRLSVAARATPEGEALKVLGEILREVTTERTVPGVG